MKFLSIRTMHSCEPERRGSHHWTYCDFPFLIVIVDCLSLISIFKLCCPFMVTALTGIRLLPCPEVVGLPIKNKRYQRGHATPCWLLFQIDPQNSWHNVHAFNTLIFVNSTWKWLENTRLYCRSRAHTTHSRNIQSPYLPLPFVLVMDLWMHCLLENFCTLIANDPKRPRAEGLLLHINRFLDNPNKKGSLFLFLMGGLSVLLN